MLRHSLIVTLLSTLFILEAYSVEGVTLTLYLRSTLYENQDCTGRIVLEQIHGQRGCSNDKLEHGEECYGMGMKQMCVADASTVKSMPNWVSTDRSQLDRCNNEQSTLVEAEGFLTGCFKTYINGTFMCSSKMVCIPGRQEFTQYSSEDCTTGVMGARLIGVETEFDSCAQTRTPYVWKITHCETPEK